MIHTLVIHPKIIISAVKIMEPITKNRAEQLCNSTSVICRKIFGC